MSFILFMLCSSARCLLAHAADYPHIGGYQDAQAVPIAEGQRSMIHIMQNGSTRTLKKVTSNVVSGSAWRTSPLWLVPPQINNQKYS